MKLCVAMDLPTTKENLKLLEELRSFNDIWVKVGFRSYIRDGKELIYNIKEINPNFKIFLDLKLYDIPNTMADASEEIAEIGVDMFNIHASAGEEAMRVVMERLKGFKNRPLVLAVTALTSFDNDSFKKIYGDDIDKKAKEFAISSYRNGLDGVVCSAFESKMVKEITSKDFITLSPAIRPFREEAGDQKRVADLEFAKENLVDFAVIGRPIYRAKEPKVVIEKILEKL